MRELPGIAVGHGGGGRCFGLCIIGKELLYYMMSSVRICSREYVSLFEYGNIAENTCETKIHHILFESIVMRC